METLPLTLLSYRRVVVFLAQEKQELVRLMYLPGNFVSTVAYGITPSVLFR